MRFNPFRSRAEQARTEAEQEAAKEAARTRAAILAEQAAELEQRSTAFDTAVAAHQLAERRETELLSTTTQRLSDAAKALATADRAAITALGKLGEVAATYDAAVAQAADELRAAGLSLRYSDGEAVADFTTGGGGREGVRIGDKRWPRLSPSDVLRRTLYGALRARGDRFAEQLYHQWRIRRLDWAGVLSDLPAAGTVTGWATGLTAAPIELVDTGDRAREEHKARVRREEHEDRQAEARRAMALAAVERGEIGVFT